LEILDMRSVIGKAQLDTAKYYALKVNNTTGHELGRFIGMSENGAAFVIVNSLVRQDRAMENVTIRDDVLPEVVFEIGEA